MATVLTSEDDFMMIVKNNIWEGQDEAYETWLENTEGYEWVDGVPKNKMFIKINDDISR